MKQKVGFRWHCLAVERTGNLKKLLKKTIRNQLHMKKMTKKAKTFYYKTSKNKWSFNVDN